MLGAPREKPRGHLEPGRKSARRSHSRTKLFRDSGPGRDRIIARPAHGTHRDAVCERRVKAGSGRECPCCTAAASRRSNPSLAKSILANGTLQRPIWPVRRRAHARAAAGRLDRPMTRQIVGRIVGRAQQFDPELTQNALRRKPRSLQAARFARSQIERAVDSFSNSSMPKMPASTPSAYKSMVQRIGAV